MVTSPSCYNYLISLAMLDARVNLLCVPTSSDVRFGNGAITPLQGTALAPGLCVSRRDIGRPPMPQASQGSSWPHLCLPVCRLGPAHSFRAIVADTPAVFQRWLCWSPVGHGGRAGGIRRHAVSTHTSHRRP